jgi:hypothetical protein
VMVFLDKLQQFVKSVCIDGDGEGFKAMGWR